MVIVIMLTSFLTVYLLTIALWQYCWRDHLAIMRRLQQWEQTVQREEAGEKLNLPFMERVVRPMINKTAGLLDKIMPTTPSKNLQLKLMMAGNPGNLTVTEFQVIKYSVGLSGLAAGLFFGLDPNRDFASSLLLVGVISGLFFYGPEFCLNWCRQKRQEEMVKKLPDVLDLLTVSVEAGLSFDGALQKVTEKMDGALASEFSRLLQEIRMGKSRREALRDLADRTGVYDLSSLVGALIQADQLGVSIGNVLRVQSEQMRRQRRQQAEEKAMKAPIKMLFPLVLFIFPTIFIVLLGPAAIQIMQTFR